MSLAIYIRQKEFKKIVSLGCDFMDGLIKQIINIGCENKINKIILFGSRARGDYTDKSDYDIAFISNNITNETKNNITNSIEGLDTFHKIDLIFLDNLSNNDELTNNIVKDGIMLMNKLDIKLNNYINALNRLKEAVMDFEKTGMLSVRDGVIQRFEFTTELAWKTTREYLIEEGVVNINTPKAVMREAYTTDIINDEQGWLQILNDRNSTSHIYNENEANEIYDRISKDHIIKFEELANILTNKK